MSKTLIELFNELPTDLQRVVNQHLFNYCVEEIGNTEHKGECCFCDTITFLGSVDEYTYDYEEDAEDEDDYNINVGRVQDRVCERCFRFYCSSNGRDMEWVRTLPPRYEQID